MVEYVDLFFHNTLFSTIADHTNSRITADSEKVTEVEMRQFVGIMFAMTVTPMSNINHY